MMTSAGLIACVVTWFQLNSHRIYASNCIQKHFITANRKKSKDIKLTLHAVWRHPIGTYAGLGDSQLGFIGDFDLERILYSILAQMFI